MAKGKRKTYVRQLSIDQIEKMLRACNGLITETAIRLKVTQPAITQRVKRSERLQKVIKEIDERRVDIAENVVWNSMKNNNLSAAIFTLKTKGRDRGYVEDRKQIVINNNPGKIENIKGSMDANDAQNLYIDMITSENG